MVSTQTLKNAARAIEHDLWTDSDGANYLVKDGAILRRWEPADSFDDAMKLALKLGISIEFWAEHDSVLAHIDNDTHSFSATEAMDEYGVRWAILRVAADIGAAL